MTSFFRLTLALSFALTGGPAWPQGINPAANQGQQSQNGGSGANNAAGSGLMGSGAGMMANPMTIPIGIALMAMGMLAMAQGSHDSGAANQSGMTAMASNMNGGGATTTAPTFTAPATGMAGIIASPASKMAVDAITNDGGMVTPTGITMPDGSSKPWSSFSSAGALQAAGFDSKALMAKVAEVEKNIDMSAAKGTGLREGEGAGGGAASPPAASNEPLENRMPASIVDYAKERAGMVAGKTVEAGGEPIGARGDNLFEIIHRAYDRKRDGNQFLLEESRVRDPATTRIQVKSR